MHISENRLEGSLLDTQLKEVLDECHEHLVTATLAIKAGSERAVLEIRAGAVDSIDYKGLRRSEALKQLHKLRDGEFELVQKLPNLSGELGDGASLEAKTGEVSVVQLMQLCEENALSCTLTVKGADDNAAIHYKAGEISSVEWNGERDDDRIVDVLKIENATVRVEAPPLKFGILSWPAVRDDPTPAFIPLQEMAAGRLDPSDANAKPVEAKANGKKKKGADANAAAELAADKPKVAAAVEPAGRERSARASRPPPTETSGITVLLSLVVGLLVLAGVLTLALKAFAS